MDRMLRPVLVLQLFQHHRLAFNTILQLVTLDRIAAFGHHSWYTVIDKSLVVIVVVVVIIGGGMRLGHPHFIDDFIFPSSDRTNNFQFLNVRAGKLLALLILWSFAVAVVTFSPSTVTILLLLLFSLIPIPISVRHFVLLLLLCCCSGTLC